MKRGRKGYEPRVLNSYTLSGKGWKHVIGEVNFCGRRLVWQVVKEPDGATKVSGLWRGERYVSVTEVPESLLSAILAAGARELLRMCEGRDRG